MDAAAGKWSPEQQNGPWCVLPVGIQSIPRSALAVIVAIRKGDKLLMSRHARGTYHRYAPYCRLCEVGETFEERVRREVMEEVGPKVKNTRYYKKPAMVIF